MHGIGPNGFLIAPVADVLLTLGHLSSEPEVLSQSELTNVPKYI